MFQPPLKIPSTGNQDLNPWAFGDTLYSNHNRWECIWIKYFKEYELSDNDLSDFCYKEKDERLADVDLRKNCYIQTGRIVQTCVLVRNTARKLRSWKLQKGREYKTSWLKHGNSW